MKLRTKLTLATTAIVVLSVLISTFLVIAFTAQKAKDELTASGIADFKEFYSSFFSGSNAYTVITEESGSAYSYLRYRFYNTSGRGEFVLQKGGELISNNTGIDAVKALDAHNPSETEIPYQGTLRYTICNISGQRYFIASMSLDFNTPQVYALSLVRNVTGTMDAVSRLGMKCAFAGAAVVLAAALLVLFFVRRSLLPVSKLEKGAIEISDGNYQSRIDIKGHDEIASLAERFNSMAEAISEKIAALGETAERQQAFIHALSHEMKTPVTSIMARAETLLVREVSDTDRERSLKRIYDQCAWLEKLSGKLTALVMLQGNVDIKPESVSKLLSAAAATVSDALDEKHITLVTDCKADALPFDFDLMRAALANLIDNARKASGCGSVITLRAYGNVMEVEDHGKGIPKDEIERITQPFYMVDRSRSKKNGGSGLGLALVERIAQAHGAKLSITSTLGEGTVVRIIFSDDVDK
jgi:signal transduction histidine kinase